MLNQTNQIVRTKTTPVIKALSELPDVKGIVCFGSYALGTFDEYSDIDLYGFCHPEMIPTDERQNVLQKIEHISNLHMNHSEFGWDNQWNPQGDRLRLGDTFFDISYNTLDWIRTVVWKVTGEGSTSIPELPFRPYTMLGLLDSSIVLYDPEGIIHELKDKIKPYPVLLKETLITNHWQIINDSLEELQDYTKREIGNTAFHFELRRIVDSISQVLFAMNEYYDPATKRTEEALKTLAVVPADFIHRYEMILATALTPDGRRIVTRELQTLVNELELLIKK